MSNKETEYKQMLTELVECVKRKNNTIIFLRGQIERIHEKGMELATIEEDGWEWPEGKGGSENSLYRFDC